MNARDEWLALRKKGVGGSDAAAALGQSRYKTMFQLYHEKVGTYDDIDASPDVAERLRFGQRMEAVIADEYAERFGVKLRRHHKIAQHPRYRFMIASFDRTVDNRREGFEAKNVDSLAFRLSDQWGDEHSDEIPPEYLLQCQHYLSVSGYERWHVAVCVGGNSLRVFHVERDPELIEMIEDGEAQFWNFVEKREAPPLDYRHPTAVPMLKRLFPNTSGETIKLPAEAVALHYSRLDFDEQEKLMHAGSEAARARLLHMMGNASIGLLPNGGSYRRKIIERKGYEVEPVEYIDFRYSKKGGPGDE